MLFRSGVGLGYMGPQYGGMIIKPYVGQDRDLALQGYYNMDDGSSVKGMLSPKQQRIDYGNDGFKFYASRDTYSGTPNNMLGFNYESPQTNASLSVNPRTRDLMAKYDFKFANGGEVKTHLTTTVPPVRGPMPQGVETLFKRRYS